MTVHRLARMRIDADLCLERIPVDLIDDEEIEESVVVGIEPAAAERRRLVVNGRLRGYVFECSVAAIVIQDIALHPRDEEIGVTVVVVIGHRGADRETLATHARTFGDIFKRSIAAIAIETPPPEAPAPDTASTPALDSDAN